MTTTIQQTGKRWKALTLVGGVLVLLGVTACTAMLGSDAGELAGSWMATIGVVTYIWGRLGAWWDHG